MKVLVKTKLSTELQNHILSKFPEHEFDFTGNFTDEKLEKAEVLLGEISSNKIKKCKNLNYIHSCYSGVERICAANIDENVQISCATGVFGQEIAEMILGMVLALKKNLLVYRDNQKAKIWQEKSAGRPLSGDKVLIMGLGDIGTSFAKILAPFGCEIAGIKRDISVKPNCVNEIFSMENLDEILPKFDLVVMCLPHTKDTVGVMSRERLFKMKKGSILVNVGRGTAIDTDALCEALEGKILSGAALDVTNPEPLPVDHPLWKMENVLVTPHVAGISESEYLIEKVIGNFIENFELFLEGKPLKTPVNRSIGYMKSEVS